MDLAVIFQTVGAAAGTLLVAYTIFVGQRSIGDLRRSRRLGREMQALAERGLEGDSPSARVGPRVTVVEWDELQAAVDEFCARNLTQFDLIIGIARGGLPIAAALAHALPEARFSTMVKTYVDVKQKPFFVFKDGTHLRSDRKKIFESFSIPDLEKKVKHILVVDDVGTFGYTLEAAELLIRAQSADALIEFFVFAADLPRLAASRPNVVERLHFHREVDNRAEWLEFPWERSRTRPTASQPD